MAELSTLARPYAKAVFELASEQKQLAAWSPALAALAAVVGQPEVSRLIGHPKVNRGELADLIIAGAGKDLPEGAANLVRTLSQNGRLNLLAAIAGQYEALRAEAEKRVDVAVTSAAELSEASRQALAAALKKRLGREVRLDCRVDQGLIGGAVIRAGDLVIDGSVKSELQRLAQAVSA